jgi:DNA-binding NarL/FixJ family response regulator
MLNLLPRSVGRTREPGTEAMTTYPVLNKALVIDPSGELRDFLRFCAGRFWPNLEIVSYLWARGCPGETYDWTGIDLVVLEHRLHNPHDQGIEWLRAMRRNPAAPAIVLISEELTESLRAEAERVGAAAVLNKNDLSPRRFAESVDRVLRRSNPDSRSVPEDLASGILPNASVATDDIAVREVPGFRIVRPIATMDRGWVSLATEESTQRTVALKVMRMTPDTDPSTLRRFKHEYGLLSTLENSNVIRVFKRGVVENRGFLATEYCPGGNLIERIRLRISIQDAIGYLVQIMLGLKAVHSCGILHRDIKPTNLLFRENGTLVLTDFGIERDLSDNPRLTTTRSLVGDLGYVSPESISHGAVDLRSDLYSAGIVFFHMLTGAEPFGSTSVTAMLDAHLHAPIPRLPRTMAALQPLIDGLLAKKPNDRFQSAADALDGIEWLTTARA